MGSGKSKDHESFTVAPADDDAPSTQPATAIEPVTASDQQLFDHYPSDDAIGPITGVTIDCHRVRSARAISKR